MKRIPLGEIKVQETFTNSNLIQNSSIEPKIISNQAPSLLKQNLEGIILHRVIKPKETDDYPIDLVKHANKVQCRVESPNIEIYSPDKQRNYHESDNNNSTSKSIKKSSILNKMKHKSKFNAYIRRHSGLPANSNMNTDQPKVNLTLLYQVTPQKLLSKIFEKNHQSLSKLNKETPEKKERSIEIEQVVSVDSSKKEEDIKKNIFSDNKSTDNNKIQPRMEKNVVCLNSLNSNIKSITMKGLKINFNQNIEFSSPNKTNHKNTDKNIIKFVI